MVNRNFTFIQIWKFSPTGQNHPRSEILFHKNSPTKDFIKTTLHIMALSYHEVTATTQKGPKILFPIRCHLLKRKRDLVQNMTQIENI